MKWVRQTPQEIAQAKRDKVVRWRRIWAWRRWENDGTREVYWMQFVWVRAKEFGSNKYQHYEGRWQYWTPNSWEVRAGTRTAPNPRECPPGMTETSV